MLIGNKLESVIKDVFYLVMKDAHPVVILYALEADGINPKQQETILRWANVYKQKQLQNGD